MASKTSDSDVTRTRISIIGGKFQENFDQGKGNLV